MEERYAEWSVKRKKVGYAVPLILGMTAALAAGFIVMITTRWGFVVFALAFIAVYFGYRFLKVEYEYIFVENEIRFDRIFSGSIRRHAFTVLLSETDGITAFPAGTKRRSENGRKLVDFTSGDLEKDCFAMRFSDKKGRKLVLFEPNEAFLNAVRKAAPQKVPILSEIRTEE